MASKKILQVDSVINRLLEVKGSGPGKNVQLNEGEIKALLGFALEISWRSKINIFLFIFADIEFRPQNSFSHA